MTQVQLAGLLGVTQPYLSMLESGGRRVPDLLARKVAAVVDTPPTELPLDVPRSTLPFSNAKLVDELASLDYPGFAYLRKGRATLNPSQLLLSALSADDLDARVVEALPWLLLRFEQLDTELLVREAKLRDLQNKLGFMAALARQVAESNPRFQERLTGLLDLERRLEGSRLMREETLGSRKMSQRLTAWVRHHRSSLAQHWNVLTDLKTEHLPYANDSGAMA